MRVKLRSCLMTKRIISAQDLKISFNSISTEILFLKKVWSYPTYSMTVCFNICRSQQRTKNVFWVGVMPPLPYCVHHTVLLMNLAPHPQTSTGLQVSPDGKERVGLAPPSRRAHYQAHLVPCAPRQVQPSPSGQGHVLPYVLAHRFAPQRPNT